MSPFNDAAPHLAEHGGRTSLIPSSDEAAGVSGIRATVPLRFGKKPRRSDFRTLRFREYIAALPPAPARFDVLANVYAKLHSNSAHELFPLDGNDTLGDCTIAAVAHATTVFCGLVGTRQITPEAKVVALYNQLGNNRDEGLIELDVLTFWRTNAIDGETIYAFARIDRANHEHVKLAVKLFGGVYLGFQVQEGCVEQFRARTPWVPAPLTNDGHAVFATGYDESGLTVLTWGDTQRATWAWWDACVDEAYAILPMQAKDPAFAPGFDLAALQKDLARIG